jgi:hypothetical protein
MTTLPSHRPGTVTERDRYFFDLHGFIVVRGALSAQEVANCNGVLDGLQHLKHGEWSGWVQGHTFDTRARDGLNLQQIYEGGEPFERLIDHPSWHAKTLEFVGGEGTFDWNQGPIFIDECFANFRGPGESIPMHSGGHDWIKRCQYGIRNGKFACGQVNVLVALNDIGPGDGGTMLLPSSHKASFPHPELTSKGWDSHSSMDGVEGAIEVHLKAGDAILFVDAIMHGSAARKNPGFRRIATYRYGPSWGNFRHGYRPSPELLERLTPQRRKIVQPLDPVMPPVAMPV